MNWRALVWRIATAIAGPQPVRVNVRVHEKVTVRDEILRDETRLVRSMASTGRTTGAR